MTSTASATPHRSLLIACLPDELIETIGREVYGDPEEWSLEGSDSLRRFAQVDRRTRRILQPLCWKTLYVTTDAKDFSKLADLLDICGPLVERLICEISPTAVKSEIQVSILTNSLKLCRQLRDIAFQEKEGYPSERSGTISDQNVSIMRALLPLAPRLRSLSCESSGANLADYAPALVVLLPHTTRLQSVCLSLYGSTEQQSASRVFAEALMRQADLRILVLSEQIFRPAERIDLPRLQHLDLDFDDYDEGLPSLITSILQSAASTLRHIGIRLPHGAADAALAPYSVTFPHLESLRLCGPHAPAYMFATINSVPSLRSLSLCWIQTSTLDGIRALYAKQPGKALREIIIERGSFAPGNCAFDEWFACLEVWAKPADVQILVEDEDVWNARKLEESQRYAGLRPRFI